MTGSERCKNQVRHDRLGLFDMAEKGDIKMSKYSYL